MHPLKQIQLLMIATKQMYDAAENWQGRFLISDHYFKSYMDTAIKEIEKWLIMENVQTIHPITDYPPKAQERMKELTYQMVEQILREEESE